MRLPIVAVVRILYLRHVRYKGLNIMNRTLFFILLGLISLSQAHGQSNKAEPSDSIHTKEYVNNFYHFSVAIPDNWKLYGQILNDTVNHRAIADWGIPMVYSDVENAEIENSISITAYKKENIRTVDALILSEYLRLDPAKYAMEVDSTTENARLIYGTINGKNYKGKSYFVFKNGIGYVINFMATPGTFDKNLAVFEKFCTIIRFL